MDGPCCWLELCCPPEAAAAVLAAHLAVPLDIATRLLSEFQLVPRNIEPVTPQGDPVPVHPVNQRLTALHAYIRAELRVILLEAGHPAGEEA
jgi:hypothetical protein